MKHPLPRRNQAALHIAVTKSSDSHFLGSLDSKPTDQLPSTCVSGSNITFVHNVEASNSLLGFYGLSSFVGLVGLFGYLNQFGLLNSINQMRLELAQTAALLRLDRCIGS